MNHAKEEFVLRSTLKTFRTEKELFPFVWFFEEGSFENKNVIKLQTIRKIITITMINTG